MANSAIQSAQFGVATESQRGVVNGTDARNLVFGGAALGFRNKIINGDMRIAQRGTSTTNATSSYVYSLDRWRFYGQSTTGSATVSQQAFTAGQTDVPNEPEYFLRWDQTVTPGGVVALTQPIEGVRTFAGQNATLSFWAKANSARSITVRLTQNFGTGGSTAVSVTSSSQALTTVWQKFTITFAVPSISGKTIGANNYLDVLFLDSNLGTFTIDIAQVQLEAGSVATPFENRPIGTELALCARYLPVIYGTLNAAQNAYPAYTQAANSFRVGIPFKVPTRAPITSITVSSAAHFGISFNGGGTSATGISLSYAGTETITLDCTVSSAAINLPGLFYTSSASAKIICEGAEL